MFAATIGFVICCIIGIFITLGCLATFTWPGNGRGERICALIVILLVGLFLKWINPFTVAITVAGP